MSFPLLSLKWFDPYAWMYSVKYVPGPGGPPSRMSVRPRLSGGWLNASAGVPARPAASAAISSAATVLRIVFPPLFGVGPILEPDSTYITVVRRGRQPHFVRARR